MKPTPLLEKIKFDQLPAGSTVATSSILRQQQVKQLNPKLETVDIRGTIEERIQKMKDGYCDGLIVATVALKRLGMEKHIQSIMPWEGRPLQGQMAIVGRATRYSATRTVCRDRRAPRLRPRLSGRRRSRRSGIDHP